MNLTHTYEAGNYVFARYHLEAADAEYGYEVVRSWPVDEVEFGPGWDDPVVAHDDEDDDDGQRLYRLDGAAFIYVGYGRGQVAVHASARTRAEAIAAVDAAAVAFPRAAAPGDDTISVRFWYATRNGPTAVTRKIAAPSWATVRDNYSAEVADGLDHLMDGFRPSHGGQIILWHGPPGTGKTYALRALCDAWRKWCSAEYIVDPENAFGSQPDYLMKLLLASQSSVGIPDDEDRWRLLILEDTGELISEDAKEKAGQGLSRLLNVTDGFLGQGLRVLVLITTNEVLERLNPAVSRPGRAARVVVFPNLTAEETAAWARAHSLPGDGRGSKRLADLYAEAEEFAPAVHPPSKPMGFAPITTRWSPKQLLDDEVEFDDRL